LTKYRAYNNYSKSSARAYRTEVWTMQASIVAHS
jgi:hypothetical protein